MNTVTFGNKNSYTDFGLILDHKEIGKPEPRTNYIDVPARDGHLDLTEAFGEVKYKERKLVFYFSYIGSDANWAKTLSALHNYLNGQRHNIYFEQDYYWVGRCFVGDAQTNRGIREFTIECDCEPYKYKLEDTIVETKRKNLFDKNTIADKFVETTGYKKYKLTLPNGLYTWSLNNTFFNSGCYAIWTDDETYTGEAMFDNYMYQWIGNSGKESECPTNGTFEVTKGYVYLATTGAITGKITDFIEKFDTMQLESGSNATAYEPYDTDIVNIINDRKTVTPYVEILDGTPILSWEDKQTGVKYNGVAINSNGKYLDLKLYEGKNTITVKGGDIRLTYREASL